MLCVSATGALAGDCGSSTKYSGTLVIDTYQMIRCSASVDASEAFTIDTDPTVRCDGDTQASESFIVATYDIDTPTCPSVTAVSEQPFLIANSSIGAMKKLPPGTQVTLGGLPITRAFGDRFYIEMVDRSSGIATMQAVTAEPGRLASVTGMLANVQGEIVVAPRKVALGDLGDAPEPLSVPSSALRLGVGADTTGLLAIVWGEAISVPQGQNWYIVSDGGMPIYVFPEGVWRPNQGDFVILTGVPGVDKLGGQSVRVFRVKEPYTMP